MEELKKLIGKPLYFEGTGNNAPRGRNRRKRIETGTITKVARVFVTVQFDDRNGEDRFRVSRANKKHLDGGYNSGWLIHESEREMKDSHEAKELALAIWNQYRHPTEYAKLDISTIRKVAELLGVKIECQQ